MSQVGLAGAVICTALLVIFIFLPNVRASVFFSNQEPDSLTIYLVGFAIFDLLCAYLFYGTWIWRVEANPEEDFFVLTDYWARKHVIHYADCKNFQFRMKTQDVRICNPEKDFSISPLLANADSFIDLLIQHQVNIENWEDEDDEDDGEIE